MRLEKKNKERDIDSISKIISESDIKLTFVVIERVIAPPQAAKVVDVANGDRVGAAVKNANVKRGQTAAVDHVTGQKGHILQDERG